MAKKLEKDEGKEFTKPIITIINKIGAGFVVFENCGKGLGYYVRAYARAAQPDRPKLTQAMFDKMIECGMLEPCDMKQPWCMEFYRLTQKARDYTGN